MKPSEFEYLVDAIKSLPSIGDKNAQKIAYFLLNQDQKFVDDFIDRINNARNAIHFCKQCGNFAIDELCNICSNKQRDNTKLCIVNNIDELTKIEATGCFDGIYFVLNDEIDIRHKKKLGSKLINQLVNYCTLKEFKEILICTNNTNNGLATNIYLDKLLKNILHEPKIYKLAIGLPVNSSLDYIDSDTLKIAIKNKTQI